ncbi:MAG: hypothetical protein WDZ94_05010 [Patescibacteria group bacterium]
MKKSYVSLALFIVILLSVAGVTYFRWERTQPSEVNPPSPYGYVEQIGSHTNPITSFSGETYIEEDEGYGISMRLPVEFKPMFLSNSIQSNQISMLWQTYADLYADEGEYTPRYALSFSVTEKNKIEPNSYEFIYESQIYPYLKNLKVGESHRYSKYSDKEKFEAFGDDYQNEFFDSDQVYTRLQDVNKWNVYSFINYHESQATYGYRAAIETESEYIDLTYFTFYEFSAEKRKVIIDYRKDIFYSILENTDLI